MPDDIAITPGSASETYKMAAASPGITKLDTAGTAHGKRRGCAPLTVAHTLLGAGVVVALAAVVYAVALPSVITSKIESGVATCKVEDVQKEAFVDQYGDCESCTPYYVNVYMLNITNAMAHLEKGEKLKMTEVGPYAYRRRQIKADVKLSVDTNQISYKMYTYHTFDADKSCAGCSDSDQVTSIDVGYVNVVSQAGGELAYVRRLVKGTLWGKGLNDSAREEIVQANKEQIMRWSNGINSNQPTAWKKLGSTVTDVLASGLSGIQKLDLSGFEYNGLFAKRPISDWALGYPSVLAGIGLGTNYKNECEKGANYNAKCATCTAATCPEIWSECKRCVSGAKVVRANALNCGRIVNKYVAAYGADQASVVNATCNLCDLVGLCVAPLPGVAESSGTDYAKVSPNVTNLNTYIQRTGCDDHTKIGEYIQFDGFKTQAVWATLDARRNPTLAELSAFTKYGNCGAKTANTTCVDVLGNDGSSTPPGGVSISGFPSKVELEQNVMYLSQVKQNISIQNTGETYELEGAMLTRFTPANDLLSYDDSKADRGTGIPLDGVQSIAFATGFLAYVSFPMYLYGDESLLDNVEITMFDGKTASREMMYDVTGKLKKEYYDRYQTIVDVEPGTGKAMRARKRLMASYAFAKSQYTPNAPMSDVLWPNLTAEIILPAYFGEESVTVTSKRLEQYTSIKSLVGTLLPVLIAGIVVGVALAGFGFLKRRRAVAQYSAAV